MKSNTTAYTVTDYIPSTPELIQAYFSLIVTIVGTIFNVFTFIVLCRSTFRNTKARPTLHYMRVMAIFDILMLYGWNLDHFFDSKYGFTIQTLWMPFCRFMAYFNYFVPQSSAWFRVFVSLDRYLSLSRLHKTWFSDSKHVLIIIGCIVVFFTLYNGMFFVFGCSYASDGSVTTVPWVFNMFPLWDQLNLGIYNCAPFVLMGVFNSGVIYHLIRLRRTTTVHNSQIQHRAISITLVITTFLFLLMTTPATIGFAFFSTDNDVMLRVLDGFLYSYHALSFPLYMIIFDEFRREFISMITCKKNDARVVPSTVTRQRTGNIA